MHNLEVDVEGGQVVTRHITSKKGLRLITLEGHLKKDSDEVWVVEKDGYLAVLEDCLSKFEGKKVCLSLELI